MTAVSLVLIWTGTLMRLASTTSLLLLIVFIVVNAALIRIRWRDGPAEGCFRVPLIVPVLAIAVCVVMLVFVERDALMWRGWCEESC